MWVRCALVVIVASVVTCQYPDTVVVDDTTTELLVVVRITAAPGTALVNVATAGGGQPNPCTTCSASSAQCLTRRLVIDDVLRPTPCPVTPGRSSCPPAATRRSPR